MKIVVLDDHPLILNFLQSEIQQILPEAQVLLFLEINPTLYYIKKNIVDFVICDLFTELVLILLVLLDCEFNSVLKISEVVFGLSLIHI